MKQNKNNILFLILSIFVAIGLSGCFKEMKSISVSAEKVEISGAVALRINETIKYIAKQTPDNVAIVVKWSIDNNEVASISDNGYITGKKTGIVNVTATTANGKKAVHRINVIPESTIFFCGNIWETSDISSWRANGDVLELTSDGISGLPKLIKLEGNTCSDFEIEYEVNKESGDRENLLMTFYRAAGERNSIKASSVINKLKLSERNINTNINKAINEPLEYYVVGLHTESNSFVSAKISSGNAQILKSGRDSNSIYENNKWNKVKIRALGNTIYFYVNNNLLWSGNDERPLSGNIIIGFNEGTGRIPCKIQFRNIKFKNLKGLSQIQKPVIYPTTGKYTTSQAVSISCATAGATIRYTTDGSEPLPVSTEYIEPFTISRTTILRARAFHDEMLDSDTAVSTITIGSNLTSIKGSGNLYEHINASGDFTFTLENLENKNVAFIFTNTDTNNTYSYPIIGAEFVKTPQNLIQQVFDVQDSPKGTYGKPEIDDFNNNPFKYPKQGMSLSEYKAFKSTMPAVEKYAVGNTETFNDDTGATTTATLRKVISANGKNLYVWVDNDCWYMGGTKTNRVNQSMVDAFAPKFLNTGTNDDIYEWVSNICGAPWGPHSYPTQFIDGNNNDIHIWLTDIDRDNSTTGGICGYFWGANNALKTNYSHSNEKIMFAIDAVMFATPENGTWELTDFWPQFMISALAHEFQHMIMFYQKPILRNTNTEAWLNEMSSQCIEDLVSDKILANGPRGVTYNDQTAGQTGNNRGRLPLYNSSNTKSLTRWDQDGDSYSRTYALGAYLIRNYGGAGFIQKLVQNNYGDQQAIVDAISANGYTGLEFGDVLQRFGTANILSSSTDVEAGYLYNKGTWVTSEVNGANYNLGSINLYNYSNTPSIYNNMPYGNQESSSNVYYNAGNTLSGTKEWTISNLNPNVKMTVVVK